MTQKNELWSRYVLYIRCYQVVGYFLFLLAFLGGVYLAWTANTYFLKLQEFSIPLEEQAVARPLSNYQILEVRGAPVRLEMRGFIGTPEIFKVNSVTGEVVQVAIDKVAKSSSEKFWPGIHSNLDANVAVLASGTYSLTESSERFMFHISSVDGQVSVVGLGYSSKMVMGLTLMVVIALSVLFVGIIILIYQGHEKFVSRLYRLYHESNRKFR